MELDAPVVTRSTLGSSLTAGTVAGSTFSSRSTSPDLMAATEATGSWITVIRRQAGLTAPPHQLSLRRRIRTGPFGSNSSCMKGPVPTPCMRRASWVAPSGTMLVNLLVISSGNSTTGSSVLNSTVWESTATMPSAFTKLRSGAPPEASSGSRMRWKV